MKNKAIFLDRDGVINSLLPEKGARETPCTAEEFELLPGVIDALARLKQAGYLLVVVTNQPNVAKGKSSLQDHLAIGRLMADLLGEKAALDGVYCCLHHPDEAQVVDRQYLADCDCRKPKPGLIHQAVKDLGIDLSVSWLVGDSETDIEAGQRAGIAKQRLIFIGQTSNLTLTVATNLLEATSYLLEEGNN